MMILLQEISVGQTDHERNQQVEDELPQMAVRTESGEDKLHLLAVR